jgi:hypothetical protein
MWEFNLCMNSQTSLNSNTRVWNLVEKMQTKINKKEKTPFGALGHFSLVLAHLPQNWPASRPTSPSLPRWPIFPLKRYTRLIWVTLALTCGPLWPAADYLAPATCTWAIFVSSISLLESNAPHVRGIDWAGAQQTRPGYWGGPSIGPKSPFSDSPLALWSIYWASKPSEGAEHHRARLVARQEIEAAVKCRYHWCSAPSPNSRWETVKLALLTSPLHGAPSRAKLRHGMAGNHRQTWVASPSRHPVMLEPSPGPSACINTFASITWYCSSWGVGLPCGSGTVGRSGSSSHGAPPRCARRRDWGWLRGGGVLC